MNIQTFILLGLAALTQAQINIPQPCRDLPVVQDFNVTRYAGLWYEIERYPTDFETGGICSTAQYGLNDDGTVTVFNTLYLGALPVSINGTARFNSTDGSAKLAVSFPITGGDEAPYWVLDTDYETYSVVWACRSEEGDSSRQSAWFLSRIQSPTPETRFKVYSVLASQEVPLEYLRITRQYDCPNSADTAENLVV